MTFFGQLIRTTVNTALLPVAVVRDVVTLGGLDTDDDKSHTEKAIARLKREAEE